MTITLFKRPNYFVKLTLLPFSVVKTSTKAISNFSFSGEISFVGTTSSRVNWGQFVLQSLTKFCFHCSFEFYKFDFNFPPPYVISNFFLIGEMIPRKLDYKKLKFLHFLRSNFEQPSKTSRKKIAYAAPS